MSMLWKSAQPSPRPPAMFVDKPAASPIRRLLMKCPHSCATIWLSIEPSRWIGLCRAMVSVTVPEPSAVLNELPAASVTESTGIVSVPVPPMAGGVEEEALSAMMQPIAPAASTFWAFARNEQVPRSINAILPEMAPPFVSAEQPSLVGAASSTTRTRLPETLKFWGPNPVATPAG